MIMLQMIMELELQIKDLEVEHLQVVHQVEVGVLEKLVVQMEQDMVEMV